jgi:hypothetical protein
MQLDKVRSDQIIIDAETMNGLSLKILFARQVYVCMIMKLLQLTICFSVLLFCCCRWGLIICSLSCSVLRSLLLLIYRCDLWHL